MQVETRDESTGAGAKAWCLLIHAEASLCPSLVMKVLGFSECNQSMINYLRVLRSVSTCAPYIKVRQCRLKPVAPRVESAWFQRLKLNCDVLVSRFAFSFNLHLYMMGDFFMFDHSAAASNQDAAKAADCVTFPSPVGTLRPNWVLDSEGGGAASMSQYLAGG